MKRVIAIVFSVVFISACAQQHETTVQNAQNRLQHAYSQLKPPESRGNVVREQGYFVPPLTLPETDGPSWFATPLEFSFNEYPLRKALQDILAPIGISLRLLDSIDAELPVSLRHQGTAGEALEQIALLTGLSYTAEERLVTWRQFEMAEFDVAFLAGTTSFFLGDDGASGVSQPMQGAGQQAVMSMGINDDAAQFLNFTSEQLSVWSDLEHALGLLLSERGAVALNQSSTSVLVRDYPQHVQQVREYLKQQNERLTRQVAIDVQVIDVLFSDGGQTGVDWSLVYETTRGSGILNIFGQGNNQPSAGASWQQVSGSGAGSQALISALSQQGVVEVSNHPRLVTLNNQISKIILEDNVTYLASAGSSSTANVGSNDLLIPGVVRTGFELFLLPKVANGQVLLQLSTSLSDLKGIDEVRSGDTTIQTPQTSRKKFFMKSIVANNETLLISGLKNSRQHWQEERSFGSWLFGGRQTRSNQQTETLVLLTPRILSSGSML